MDQLEVDIQFLNSIKIPSLNQLSTFACMSGINSLFILVLPFSIK